MMLMVRNRISARSLLFLLVMLMLLALNPFSLSEATAANHPILYLFWGDGCPHCEKEKEFLNTLYERYPEVEMRWFETWNHPEFAQLADALRQAYKIERSSVPMTFIGEWGVIGYLSDEVTGRNIEKQVYDCLQNECVDPLKKLGPRNDVWRIMEQAANKNPEEWEQYPARPRSEQDSAPQPQPTPEPAPPEKPGCVLLPVFNKEVCASQVSLPVFTLIIGGFDGFNPCAIWVLSFLLTLVIYAKSRSRILLIGGIFVVTSGVIYFLFMFVWISLFNLAEIVGYVKVLRNIIGIVAVVMGLINCKDFFFFKKGLSLSIPESAQPKLFKRMRKVINTAALPGVIFGTIVLAVSANFIELLCTAGFPAIYTNILKQQNLSTLQEYLYLVLYNIIYVIPLAVIVGMFSWKMGGRKLSEKEGRILKLVAGVMMLALGIILLVKPELLMFG